MLTKEYKSLLKKNIPNIGLMLGIDFVVRGRGYSSGTRIRPQYSQTMSFLP